MVAAGARPVKNPFDWEARLLDLRLSEREAERSPTPWQREEPREVAARGLRAALEHVSGHDGTGQRIVVRDVPAVVRGSGTEDERGVGHATGDHDVGARLQRSGDAEATEVGVGRQDAAVAERTTEFDFDGVAYRQHEHYFLTRLQGTDVTASPAAHTELEPPAGG